MNKIKSIELPTTEDSTIKMEDIEIYQGEYRGDNCIFFVASGRVLRIDKEGRLNQGSIEYYQDEITHIRIVTSKVRIIVED